MRVRVEGVTFGPVLNSRGCGREREGTGVLESDQGVMEVLIIDGVETY